MTRNKAMPSDSSRKVARLAYSINEAAEAIGCSRFVIDRAIQCGDLKSRKLGESGRKHAIAVQDLHDWFNSRPLHGDAA